ncbi:MAG: tRNA (guanosine(46)-N7)-methyltransferase TrmB [Planctomycetes bacterium]|nr:tRNA (guanosine(46)-N7)-methyltransferase TrmB [Planctomycetota bacterium]
MLGVEEIMVEPPAEGQVVDPMAWFESPGPLEIEIGCGKGGFLLNRARVHPEIRMLGIEWANKYYRYCADRMARWGVRNVRVMRTDAKFLVLHHLPPGCVSVLHLYHPDPWPKKRHHKRRLVQMEFAQAVVRMLVPGGKWFIQSDHEEYFQQIHEVLGACAGLEEISWDEDETQPGPDWAGTNFEIKYAREGRTIHRIAYRRR